MRKLLIAFIGLGLISLVTSCEKQLVESELPNLAPVNSPLEANVEKVEPTFSAELLDFTEKIVFKEPTATSRNSTLGYSYQEVYSNSYTLETGHWVNLEVNKEQLSPDFQYVAVLTPEYGDPDLYVRSHRFNRNDFQYTRSRRSSIRRGQHLDESWMNFRDIDPFETHGSFYLHASYNCNFKLSIYQVPTRTIWVRHASSYYGQRNIGFRYRGQRYDVQPRTAIALDYDYADPNFSVWQCNTSVRFGREYCSWRNGTTAATEENYMYSLSDGESTNEEGESSSSGDISFAVTTSFD